MSSLFLQIGVFMTRKKDADFIKKLKLAMLESGFNQVSLAEKLGIKPASISQWLTGKNNPKISTLEKVAKITGKPVNYFFDNSVSVKGNSNIVGKNNKASSDDLQKDMQILSTKIELLEAKLQILETEIKSLKHK